MKNKKKIVNLQKVASHLSESEMNSVSGGGLWGSMTDYLTAVGHICGAVAEIYDYVVSGEGYVAREQDSVGYEGAH